VKRRLSLLGLLRGGVGSLSLGLALAGCLRLLALPLEHRCQMVLQLWNGGKLHIVVVERHEVGLEQLFSSNGRWNAGLQGAGLFGGDNVREVEEEAEGWVEGVVVLLVLQLVRDEVGGDDVQVDVLCRQVRVRRLDSRRRTHAFRRMEPDLDGPFELLRLEHLDLHHLADLLRGGFEHTKDSQAVRRFGEGLQGIELARGYLHFSRVLLRG
jgi:hypothetical protein